MREIKFRAWVKEDSEMKGYMIPHDSPELNYSELIDTHNENGNTLLMQFTGLKDKNGVDIYESDILEYKNDLGRHHKYIVFRVDGGLAINTHDSDFGKEIQFYEAVADMQTAQWIKQCTIIGNIYQNPELLNN